MAVWVLLPLLLVVARAQEVVNVSTGTCTRCWWETKYREFPPLWARSAERNEDTLIAGDSIVYINQYLDFYRTEQLITTVYYMFNAYYAADGVRYRGQPASPEAFATEPEIVQGGCRSPMGNCGQVSSISKLDQFPLPATHNNPNFGYGSTVTASTQFPTFVAQKESFYNAAMLNLDAYGDVTSAADVAARLKACMGGVSAVNWNVEWLPGLTCSQSRVGAAPLSAEEMGVRRYAAMTPWSPPGDRRPTSDSLAHPSLSFDDHEIDVNYQSWTDRYRPSTLAPGQDVRVKRKYWLKRNAPANITLWCGPQSDYQAQNDAGQDDSALNTNPQSVSEHCGPNAVFNFAFGVCICLEGYGGLHCDQAVPTGFDPRTATVCPNASVYDMCSGRGVCAVNDDGVGLHCKCKRGWFPGTWGLNATEVYQWKHMDLNFHNYMRDYEDTVNLYASFYNQDCANGSSTTWRDSSGWTEKYPRLHLCAFWNGPLRHNYETAGTQNYQITPIFPYRCADRRSTGGYLYGGWWCKACTAGCAVNGTANCSDVDPEAAMRAPTENATGTEVKCYCRRGWAGDNCAKSECPISSNRSHTSTLPCGEDKGWGTCNSAPADHRVLTPQYLSDGSYRVAWNNSYAGRCVCNDGYSGTDNTCSQQVCAIHPHTGEVCGAHGSCVYSNCTTETVEVNNITFVQEAIQECDRFCATNGEPNGCNGTLVTVAEMYAGFYPDPDAIRTSDLLEFIGFTANLTSYPNAATLESLITNLQQAVFFLHSGSHLPANITLRALQNDIEPVLFHHRFVGSSTEQPVEFLNDVLCSLCHQQCQINPERGNLDVINQTLVKLYSMNFTSNSTCATGTCVCETGWGFNPDTDTCDWRLCDDGPNGEECSGLLISTRYSDHGLNVCNRDPDTPKCECWRNFTSGNPASADNQIDGTYGDTCQYNYSSVCNNAEGLYCSNYGTCRVEQCRETTWAGCTPGADRAAAPQCFCQKGTSGDQCEVSDCGGYSSTAPCSAVNNGTGIRFTTGVCDLLDDECKCKEVDGVMYVGDNCENAAPNCTAGDGKACSGHGDCLNIGGVYVCSCDSGYSGHYCQTSTPCGGTCNETGGTCIGGTTCQCFEFRSGADCSEQLCEDTGGVSVGTDHCDCTDSNGTLYPGEFDLSPTSFKGCRRLCPISTIIGVNAECGGEAQLTSGGQKFSRCQGPQVPANNITADAPTCDCSFNGPNPNVNNQIQTWLSDGAGACKPKCLYCEQSSTTGNCLPDNCPNTPCQYTGTYCDEPRCANGGVWNGTGCGCAIDWLHDDASNCSSLTDVCAGQGLGNFSKAPDIEASGGHHCLCTFPYVPDTTPTSATYRLCKSACGPYGTPEINTTSGTCECNAVVEGAYCNVSKCAESGIPNSDGSACLCNSEFPQWGGTYCNVSQCQNSGTPYEATTDRPGCACPLGWTGTLCESQTHPRPGSHGTHNDDTDTYECKPGYSGAACNISACGSAFPIEPVPCGNLSIGEPACVFSSLDYNCYCSQGGLPTNFYEPSGTCLPALTSDACGTYGRLGAGGNNGNTLVCHCNHPWITGDLCDEDPCGNGGAGAGSGQRIVETSTGSGVYECACIHYPYRYDTSTNCVKKNCTAMKWPEATAQGYGDVIQVDDQTCGCSVSGHVLRYDIPSWANATEWQITHQTNGDRVWCGFDCHPVNTASETATGCTCSEPFTGTDCRSVLPSNPASPSKFPVAAIAGIIGGAIALGVGGYLIYRYAIEKHVSEDDMAEPEERTPLQYPRLRARIPVTRPL